MSRILPPPEILFQTKEETLAAIQNPTWMGWISRFKTKSVWLCQELNEYERTIGFPYNAEFQKWIEKKEGIGPFNENASPLSTLIYNAQQYRKSDRLVSEGWQSPTREIIEEAMRSNRMVEVLVDGFLSSSAKLCKIIRGANNTHYAIPKGKRTRGYMLNDQPVRLQK